MLFKKGGNFNLFITNQLGHQVTEELMAEIKGKSLGNPFYMEQFCLYLKEKNFIELQEGYYILKKAPESLPVEIHKACTISKQSASSLEELDTESNHIICFDPPYYDNVMYGELSDYFYVWMKRSLGDIYPEFFKEELTNKDEEAVANAARFASLNIGILWPGIYSRPSSFLLMKLASWPFL